VRPKLFGKLALLTVLTPFLGISLLIAEEGTYFYTLKNADIVKIDRTENDTIITLTGDVNLIYDEIEFFADNAQVFQSEKRVKCSGKVKAIQDTLEAGANHTHYTHETGELNLYENAYFIESGKEGRLRTVEADTINYYKNRGDLDALGNVVLNELKEEIILHCGALSYDIDEGYGLAKNNPELTLNYEEPLKIYSKQMEFFSQTNKFIATYDVKIAMRDAEAFSRFLIYFRNDNMAVLLGEPEFYSEAADAFAEEFHIFFKEEAIDKLDLKDNSRIYFKNKGQEDKSNYLFATNITLTLIDEKIRQIDAENVTKSFLEQPVSEKSDYFINKLATSFLKVYLDEEEEIEKIISTQDIAGTYKFPSQE
jgi:lipopolysaccharide export system protein LptA